MNDLRIFHSFSGGSKKKIIERKRMYDVCLSWLIIYMY
jgi:hypothetical protein